MKNNFFDRFMENNIQHTIISVPVEKIQPSRYQPRLHFDEQKLDELSQSIQQNGLIQPLTVRKVDDGFELIAGERRYRACRKAGFQEIPCYVLTPSDDEAAQMALIENVQRQDLSAIEEAKSYVQIMKQAHLSQEQVAKKIGKSQSAVANKLRLLSLTDEVQDALLHEQISERHARALLNVTDPKRQVELLNKVISTRMTVRELDEEIKNGSSSTSNNENSIGTMPNLSNADPKVNNSFTDSIC